VYGEAAASVHWTAFVARDGNDMCNNANTLWSRNYFNRVAVIHLGITLHAVRHTWIGYGRRLCAAFVDSQDDQFKKILTNANARMSVHNARQERTAYAGEDGAFMGYESTDRAVYRAISMNFNEKVFGQCGKRLYTRGSQAASAVTAMKSAATQVAQLASAQPQASGSAPAPSPTRAPASAQAAASIAVVALQTHRIPPPQAREAATTLSALAAFPSHFDQINDSPFAPTVLGDAGVYGIDLLEASTDHAPCPCGPRGGISPDCLSSIQEKITKAVEMQQVVLLHQKPGFGKTMTIFKLLREGYFCMIFVPTNPLKDQVQSIEI
jgi:hypothetical protein